MLPLVSCLLIIPLFALCATAEDYLPPGSATQGLNSINASSKSSFVVPDSPTPRMGQKNCVAEKVDVGIPSRLQIEVCHFRGTRPGPTAVIWSGVHGGEFVGIGALHLLLARLEPSQIRGHLIISPVVNPPAVFGGRLGVSPLDGLNLNRVFPGKPDGKPTERLAHWLFSHLLAGANAFVDLHSGGIDEFLQEFAAYRKGAAHIDTDRRARAMARAVGMANVIYGRGVDDGNSHAAAAKAGIPAILIESGHLGSRNSKDAECLFRRLLNLLASIGTLQMPSISQASNLGSKKCKFTVRPREWVWSAFAEANSTGLWFPRQFQPADVDSGQVLGHIVDPASDRILEQFKAPTSGRIFYGMNGLTVTKGTFLAAIAVQKGDEG